MTLEAIDVTHDELVMNGVSVQMKPAKDLPPVQDDRVQLLQVMVNLIITAVLPMRYGGNSSSMVRAACKSAVAKPSVNRS